jgi:hypothetical protein
VLADLPLDIFAAVQAQCDKISHNFDQATPANADLAGAIEKEYAVDGLKDQLEPYLQWLSEEYDHHYHYTHTVDHVDSGHRPWQFSLDSVWANFQCKHEFNPVHNHGGTLSFVIWVKIPYDLKTEFEQSHEYNNYAKTTSCFQFLVTNTMGQIVSHTLPVDKSWEGKIMIFPAKMMHTVYPFYTSDDYRVSVSGNIIKKIID